MSFTTFIKDVEAELEAVKKQREESINLYSFGFDDNAAQTEDETE